MSLLSSGAGSYSRLGRRGDNTKPLPVDLSFDGINCMGVGWRHNILVTNSGVAYGWGYNDDDQLGVSCRETLNPEVISAFEQMQIKWCHCGDNSTVFLTEQGELYAIGSTYGRNPVRLQCQRPAVFCTSGVGKIYAIDNIGNIFSCSGGRTGAGTEYHLPYPVCDLAAGNSFCLAVTVNGRLYAKGNEAACGCGTSPSPDSFILVPSMSQISVSRVFAYKYHAVVLAADGRVFVSGKTSLGRIGLPESLVQVNTFQHLTFFDSIRVVEADCGDEHTVFVTEDGDVYSCGVNEDGRCFADVCPKIITPAKGSITGKATFVRCGSSHSVVLVNARRPLHPGLLHFGLLTDVTRQEKIIRIFDMDVNISLALLTSLGLLPGDYVSFSLTEKVPKGKTGSSNVKVTHRGRVIGCVGERVLVKTEGSVKLVRNVSLFERENKTLVKMLTYSGREILIDQEDDVCLPFGLRANETIHHKHLGRGKVAGYANGTIWFSFERFGDRICRTAGTSLQDIYETIEVDRDGIECDGVLYPCERCTPFSVWTEEGIGKVLGSIADWFFVYLLLKKTMQLVMKRKCYKIQENDLLRQFDRIKTKDGEGFVFSIVFGEVFISYDDDWLKGNTPKRLRGDAEVLFRESSSLVKDGVTIGLEQYNNLQYRPGDIYYYNGMYNQVIGEKDNVTVWKHDREEHIDDECLVLRYCGEGMRLIDITDFGYVEISVSYKDFAGMLYLPMDLVNIEGKIYTILGIREGHLYSVNAESNEYMVFDPNSYPDAKVGRIQICV